jgi:hypothetical protein
MVLEPYHIIVKMVVNLAPVRNLLDMCFGIATALETIFCETLSGADAAIGSFYSTDGRTLI